MTNDKRYNLIYIREAILENATIKQINIFMAEEGLHKDDCRLEPCFDDRDYDQEGKDSKL